MYSQLVNDEDQFMSKSLTHPKSGSPITSSTTFLSSFIDFENFKVGEKVEAEAEAAELGESETSSQGKFLETVGEFRASNSKEHMSSFNTCTSISFELVDPTNLEGVGGEEGDIGGELVK